MIALVRNGVSRAGYEIRGYFRQGDSVFFTFLFPLVMLLIFSVAFRDPRNGMTVGGDYRKERDAVDNAAVTHDGGRTWSRITGLSGFRSVVAPVPGAPRSWIAVGPSGADVSSDDGSSWSAVAGEGYHAFAFAPGKPVGWGVGENGRIGKLTK